MKILNGKFRGLSKEMYLEPFESFTNHTHSTLEPRLPVGIVNNDLLHILFHKFWKSSWMFHKKSIHFTDIYGQIVQLQLDTRTIIY
jgi:hypothetical protein